MVSSAWWQPHLLQEPANNHTFFISLSFLLSYSFCPTPIGCNYVIFKVFPLRIAMDIMCQSRENHSVEKASPQFFNNTTSHHHHRCHTPIIWSLNLVSVVQLKISLSQACMHIFGWRSSTSDKKNTAFKCMPLSIGQMKLFPHSQVFWF